MGLERILGKVATQFSDYTQYIPPLCDVLPTHPLMPLTVYFISYALIDKQSKHLNMIYNYKNNK